LRIVTTTIKMRLMYQQRIERYYEQQK
jgi:hypothetical protein